MTQSQLLAETAEQTRNIFKFYMSKLKGVDMYREFEMNGQKFNSAVWVICHCAWGENNLLLKATHGKPVTGFEWLDLFKIGAKPLEREKMPSLEEALKAFKEIHAKAMEHVKSLTDDQLNQKNTLNSSFLEGDTVKFIIQHHIRHEAMHAGHISWIVKMYGTKSI